MRVRVRVLRETDHSKVAHDMEEHAAPVNTENVLVSKKKNNGSLIWRWFGFKTSDEQQKQPICRECYKSVVSKCGSTSNLFHHLQLYHKVKYDEYLHLRATTSATKTTQPQPKTSAPKQSSLEPSFTRSVPYEKKSRKWCDITNAVTYHIAKDMVPIATVEKEGFKLLLKIIDPRYKLPNRKYFASEALPQMYSEAISLFLLCYCLSLFLFLL
ncbi:E3 SUMO-protein ligase ZBED1 [Labeo rohita]|uniref:E3 SUMO-protein ligase ZBED1 n=1 Tax=Labeo rohita TaxID=84645 RepID=A0ABQ8MR05_LABRO|nr:E3 SUMO-protein ligase ZBED1 [Labeo rohita]